MFLERSQALRQSLPLTPTRRSIRLLAKELDKESIVEPEVRSSRRTPERKSLPLLKSSPKKATSVGAPFSPARQSPARQCKKKDVTSSPIRSSSRKPLPNKKYEVSPKISPTSSSQARQSPARQSKKNVVTLSPKRSSPKKQSPNKKGDELSKRTPTKKDAEVHGSPKVEQKWLVSSLSRGSPKKKDVGQKDIWSMSTRGSPTEKDVLITSCRGSPKKKENKAELTCPPSPTRMSTRSIFVEEAPVPPLTPTRRSVRKKTIEVSTDMSVLDGDKSTRNKIVGDVTKHKDVSPGSVKLPIRSSVTGPQIDTKETKEKTSKSEHVASTSARSARGKNTEPEDTLRWDVEPHDVLRRTRSKDLEPQDTLRWTRSKDTVPQAISTEEKNQDSNFIKVIFEKFIKLNSESKLSIREHIIIFIFILFGNYLIVN